MPKKPIAKTKPVDTAKQPKTAARKRPDWSRRVRQSAKMARILQILQLIQSRGRWDTKSIAAELECAERTVYRDLQVLQFAGVPHYRDSDNFIRVRSDYRFPVPNLTDEEVLGQALATAVTRAFITGGGSSSQKQDNAG